MKSVDWQDSTVLAEWQSGATKHSHFVHTMSMDPTVNIMSHGPTTPACKHR